MIDIAKEIIEKNLGHCEIEALKQQHQKQFDRTRLSNVTNCFKRRKNRALVVERIKTGYPDLDQVLGGGIPMESITGLSGAPSVGKSTFALQMAEQIAEQGHYVLYFSYEMSGVQVGSKSVARKYFVKNNKDQDTSISGLSLINNQFWENEESTMYLTDEQWEKSEEIAAELEAINERLFFVDCTLNPMTIDEIHAYVSNWTEVYGKVNRPVVVIDYLHMIKPPLDDKGRPTMNTDKQILDYNMRGIRTLASTFKCPVVFISALKKDDFNSTADMASLSGSSGIPYNCDIIISLQYGKLGTPNEKFDLQFEQSRNPRRVEAVITKNRFFMVGSKIKFDYYSKFDYFDVTANKTGWTDKSTYDFMQTDEIGKPITPTPSKQNKSNLQPGEYEGEVVSKENDDLGDDDSNSNESAPKTIVDFVNANI